MSNQHGTGLSHSALQSSLTGGAGTDYVPVLALTLQKDRVEIGGGKWPSPAGQCALVFCAAPIFP